MIIQLQTSRLQLCWSPGVQPPVARGLEHDDGGGHLLRPRAVDQLQLHRARAAGVVPLVSRALLPNFHSPLVTRSILLDRHDQIRYYLF